jgi:hypothetical protein
LGMLNTQQWLFFLVGARNCSDLAKSNPMQFI